MINIYSQKQRWKVILFFCAVVIIGVSMAYTNFLVKNIARDEEKKVRLWANTIREKANLVKLANELYDKIGEEEQRKSEIWAKGVKQLVTTDLNGDVTFIFDLIQSNQTVPVILTDSKGIIERYKNLDPQKSKDSTYLYEQLEQMRKFKKPTRIVYNINKVNYLYYKDSKLFEELRFIIDELAASFFDEVLANSSSTPVIYTDSTKENILYYNNIKNYTNDSFEYSNTDTIIRQASILDKALEEMYQENEPIRVELKNGSYNYIFYKESELVSQLRYFPIIQFLIICLFVFISYLMFSSSRRAEQNQVWVGMSKETAHQLGTPISSLMAWLELLKMKHGEDKVFDEIGRDVERLEMITDRFSKIGSEPELLVHNLSQAVESSVEYLRNRISKKVEFIYDFQDNESLTKISLPLFGWVIENISKNAVDAMEGIGTLTYTISREENWLYLDITDTGKGIPKNKQNTIFQPGFTTKKRGWGLGLTLVKRIITNYHEAKIFVKQSSPNGTTFRITLNAIQDINQSQNI